MIVIKLILIILILINSGSVVTNIGKPREPITSGQACFVIVANAIMAIMIAIL